jgi:hypothetical protein
MNNFVAASFMSNNNFKGTSMVLDHVAYAHLSIQLDNNINIDFVETGARLCPYTRLDLLLIII